MDGRNDELHFLLHAFGELFKFAVPPRGDVEPFKPAFEPALGFAPESFDISGVGINSGQRVGGIAEKKGVTGLGENGSILSKLLIQNGYHSQRIRVLQQELDPLTVVADIFADQLPVGGGGSHPPHKIGVSLLNFTKKSRIGGAFDCAGAQSVCLDAYAVRRAYQQ